MLTEADIDQALTEQGFHGHSGGYTADNTPSWDDQGLHKPAGQEKYRTGSNCASQLATEISIVNFLRYCGSRMASFSNHSRDGRSMWSAVNCLKPILEDIFYRRPQDWPQYGVHHNNSAANMPIEDFKKLFMGACQAAADLIGYGDERLLANLIREEAVRQANPDMLILSGIEVNLTADGQLDTTMVYDRRIQVVALSLHPAYDPWGFAPMGDDPDHYSRFLATAVRTHRPHVLSHPGYGFSMDFIAALDWNLLAQACLESQTLLEINWSPVYHELSTNPQRHAADAEGMAWTLTKTPIVSNPAILDVLEDYSQRGLVLALDADRHGIPEPHHWDTYTARRREYAAILADVLTGRQLHLANNWSIDQMKSFFVNRWVN